MTESPAELARKHEISMNYKAPAYMVLTEKGWVDTREKLVDECEKLEAELKDGPRIVSDIKAASDMARESRKKV